MQLLCVQVLLERGAAQCYAEKAFLDAGGGPCLKSEWEPRAEYLKVQRMVQSWESGCHLRR